MSLPIFIKRRTENFYPYSLEYDTKIWVIYKKKEQDCFLWFWKVTDLNGTTLDLSSRGYSEFDDCISNILIISIYTFPKDVFLAYKNKEDEEEQARIHTHHKFTMDWAYSFNHRQRN